MTANLEEASIRRRGAVAVIVRDERFLVIRRSAQVLAPGALCFPGGGIEGAETDAEALVREFREELNAEVQPLRRLWTSVTRWQVQLHWWLAHLDEAAPLCANPAEVESVHWLTAEEMLAHEKLLESNREFLAAVAAGQIVL
jgi:8-oxo-dGTP pyrophosphatase MutT (NUDIX family)